MKQEERSIDERMESIMQMKEEFGDFSLDLYYNDCDKENPYTAKVKHLQTGATFHARGKSFHCALDEVERWIAGDFVEDGEVLVGKYIVKTKKKTITSANILDVEVGTTGLQGGDSGHGGRTYFRIQDCGCTDMSAKVEGPYNDQWEGDVSQIELIFGGDCELDTFIEALEFAAETLREQRLG